MIRKQKILNDKIEKYNCENKNDITHCYICRLGLLRTVLCIFLAIIICSGCALLEILLLKGRIQSIMNNSSSENDKIRIYIDQGHNPLHYHNSGAEGNGLYEQDLTFNIGRMLAELLEEDGRFEVCLSRPDESTVLGNDTASSLDARVDGARV